MKRLRCESTQPVGKRSGGKYFLCSSLLGEMIQFDQYFSIGLKPPSIVVFSLGNWILSKWIFFFSSLIFLEETNEKCCSYLWMFRQPWWKGCAVSFEVGGVNICAGVDMNPLGMIIAHPQKNWVNMLQTWKTPPSLKKIAYFQVRTVSFRKGIYYTFSFLLGWGGLVWVFFWRRGGGT